MKTKYRRVRSSGASARASLPSLSASCFCSASANGSTGTCCPGSLSGDEKPLTKTMSPARTGPDFISPGRPFTQATLSPVATAYESMRNDPGASTCSGPPGGS